MSGKQVKARVEQLGIPLTELAHRLRVSPQTLEKRLNVADIKVGVLAQIAAATGESIHYFVSDSPVFMGTAAAYREEIKEKEQTIADLRRIISLYEQLHTA